MPADAVQVTLDGQQSAVFNGSNSTDVLGASGGSPVSTTVFWQDSLDPVRLHNIQVAIPAGSNGGSLRLDAFM